MNTPKEKDPPDKPRDAAQQKVNISCTRGFAGWLTRNQVSLAFTSYQTGRHWSDRDGEPRFGAGC